MAVYVDAPNYRFRRMKMCHMIAGSIAELHVMADCIGVKRRWFQPESTPHYDICLSKRQLALRSGAKEIDRKKLVGLIRAWRKNAI